MSLDGIKNPVPPRIPVGIWAQWPAGGRWSNEGMTRVLGFLIEGIAKSGAYIFRLVVPNSVRNAAEADLACLNATRDVDYSIHSPSDMWFDADRPEELAEFANNYVNVEGWLSLFPMFTAARNLKAPVTTVFPDAIPLMFHQFGEANWGEGGGQRDWLDRVLERVGFSARFITFSDHVAEQQLTKLFGVPSSAIHVVPHASPDLAPLLPFIHNRQKTSKSLIRAADMLRDYAAMRGLAYLIDYPFEEVPFIAISTQDRVTKNLHLLAECLKEIVRHDRDSIKIIATATIDYAQGWGRLPILLRKAQLQGDFLSMPDVPPDIHAALLHCANVVVHPSIFEGGHAPFPFYEAVSVGTPCLIARGPHVRELCQRYPGVEAFTFDPSDRCGLAEMIRNVLNNPQTVMDDQLTMFAWMSLYGWSEVAADYARIATMQPV